MLYSGLVADEIELSLMGGQAAAIQPLLDEFEARHGLRVRPRLLAWDMAWSDLVKVALYSDGPDVSEIGSTWLGDLVAMDALRPFEPADLAALGQAAAFLPSTWLSTQLISDPHNWSIPWLTGARLLYYRRRLLEQAGVTESAAFGTPAQLEATLARLQDAGVPVPWTVPTGPTHTTLLNVASWVWGEGGDFLSPDGKRTLFSQPEARAGMRAYFALGRYLPLPVQHLTGLQPDDQFLRDPGTALTLSGPWLFGAVQRQGSPDLAEQLGVALPPGPSFVGGSHLVVWKHSRHPEAALRLVAFLTQRQAQLSYSQAVGLIPTRLEALAAPPFATHPLWQLAIQGVRTGRSFVVTRSWGLMEDRLTTALAALWNDVLADPGADLEALIQRRLEPLAKRLDLVLGQS
jgi:multiple sugar transport system substrate-binding protein